MANKKLISKSYKANLSLTDESSKKKQKKELPKSSESDFKDSEASKSSKSQEIDGKSQSKEKEVRLFHDETFKGFFRRLSWSNDGKCISLN